MEQPKNNGFDTQENPNEDIQKRFEGKRAGKIGGAFGEILEEQQSNPIEDIDDLEKNLNADTTKPKVTKIKASDRILPKNFIPDEEKDSAIRMKIGAGLPVALVNLDTGEMIAIPQLASEVYKHSIRKTRERYSDPNIKHGRYDRIQQIMKDRVRRILSARLKDGKITNADIAKFDADRWEARAYTSVKEYDRLLPTTFGEIENTTTENSPDATPNTIEMPTNISDWNKMFPENVVDVLRVVEKKEPTNKNEQVETKESRGSILSLLQKLRLAIGRSKSHGGKWSTEAVGRHIELEDEITDAWAHRLSVCDIYTRVKSGQLKTMPSKILSVASGPHGEARAEHDLKHLYEELNSPAPTIVSMDLTHEMLSLGAIAMKEKYGDAAKEPLSVQAKMEEPYPFKPESFDLVECTAMDVLGDDTEAINRTVEEMTTATTGGGLVRFTHRFGFNDEFANTLKDNNLHILTVDRSILIMPDAMFKELGRTKGEEKAKNIKERVERGLYYILAQKPTHEEQSKKETKIINETMPTIIRSTHDRLQQIESAVQNNKIQEAKNLFWQYGSNGRLSAIEGGEIQSKSIEAKTLRELISASGAQIYLHQYNALSRRVFGRRGR